jgi:hypothetical protein
MQEQQEQVKALEALLPRLWSKATAQTDAARNR